jgi:hypothetical protein
MRIKKKTWVTVPVLIAVASVGLTLLYWRMPADPRLQIGMTQDEVSHILGSQGMQVHLDPPPHDVPDAKYYVFYEAGTDIFGIRRVVTVYYDGGKQLVKYQVAALPHGKATRGT